MTRLAKALRDAADYVGLWGTSDRARELAEELTRWSTAFSEDGLGQESTPMPESRIVLVPRSAELVASTTSPKIAARHVAARIRELAALPAPELEESLRGLITRPADVIDHARRICYRADPREDPNDSVRAMIARGHGGILEHTYATLELVCERSLSHELVRHRLASYAQESQRYVDERGNLSIIVPGDFEVDGPDWHDSLLAAEFAFARYRAMRERGVRPENARNVLPNSAATRIVMTANLREWRWVLCLRKHKAAHPDMRRLMRHAHEELRGWCPVGFETLPEAHFEERVRARLAQHPDIARGVGEGGSLFDCVVWLLEDCGREVRDP